MGPCLRNEKYEKCGFIYPEAAHGLFGHVCTPKQKSGATCSPFPQHSHLPTSSTTIILDPSSASFHRHHPINTYHYAHTPHIR